MAGNANSGRKRNTTKQINIYLEQNKGKIPQLLAELTAQALACNLKRVKCPKCFHDFTLEVRGGGNIEAIKWLLERHYGKAAQSIDVRAKTLLITGEELAAIVPQLLLSEGTAMIEESATEPIEADTPGDD